MHSAPRRDHVEDRRTLPAPYEHLLRRLRARFARDFLGASPLRRDATWSDARFLQSYPDLQPLYDAARSYLEVPQRINLLNTRVEVSPSYDGMIERALIRYAQVLQDMLQLLKESVASRHAERLEQIVIALIGLEISEASGTLL
jgi:hypothetical protein